MLKYEKCNDITVGPINKEDKNKDYSKTVKGYNMFPHKTPYVNVFVCAKKNSGKTSAINKIINETTDKTTCFWIFCSTHSIDDGWRTIIKNLEDNGNVVNCFDSLLEGKINVLDTIINDIGNPYRDEEPEDKKKEAKSIVKFGEVEKKKKRKKKKPLVPLHMFIFDDFSTFLRDKSISALVKTHRHLKSSVIISSQYLNDIQPQCLLQIDILLCFKSLSEEKLLGIHKSLDLCIDFNKFLDIYRCITEEPYTFMYLNVRSEEIRQNFNKRILH